MGEWESSVGHWTSGVQGAAPFWYRTVGGLLHLEIPPSCEESAA